MGHCPVDRLGDLEPVFDEIRAWPAVEERKLGIFYVKRSAFLHFHMNPDGTRWADARNGPDWRQGIGIPIGAGATTQRRFLRDVRRCYRATARLLGVG